jgi:hypothetical protein
MNEQLKQMALQAGFPPHWTTDDDDLIEMWEKYAELIIKKCRDIVSDTRDQAIEDGWKVDEAMSTAMFDIEDYFGDLK